MEKTLLCHADGTKWLLTRTRDPDDMNDKLDLDAILATIVAVTVDTLPLFELLLFPEFLGLEWLLQPVPLD